MEKGAFRRIAAPFIRDTARRATLPRPRETMRPSIYRMKTRRRGVDGNARRLAASNPANCSVSVPNWTERTRARSSTYFLRG